MYNKYCKLAWTIGKLIMSYEGKVKKRIYKKRAKIKIDFKSYLFWWGGIVISFFPVFIDILVHEAHKESFDKAYWSQLCLKGDILWILATILIMTVISYENDEHNSNIVNNCSKVCTVLWGCACICWGIFKYEFPNDYIGNWPIIITCSLGVLVVLFCSPLQIRITNESGRKLRGKR